MRVFLGHARQNHSLSMAVRIFQIDSPAICSMPLMR
jgi:hypothetical protein